MGVRESGFTYAFLLGVLATGTILLGVTNHIASTEIKREKERELLFRGGQYYNAIKSYYNAGNPAVYPRSLSDLILDPRFPHKIHLRKLYKDPTQNKNTDFEIILNSRGEIVGVKSLTQSESFKSDNFPDTIVLDGDGSSYHHWQFLFRPESKTFDK